MKSQLRNLFKEQQGTCSLCGCLMGESEASIDHIIPKKHGGYSGPRRAVHKLCNEIRGHDTTERDQSYFKEKRLALELKHKRKKKHNALPMIAKNRIKNNWMGAGVIMDDLGKLFFHDNV